MKQFSALDFVISFGETYAKMIIQSRLKNTDNAIDIFDDLVNRIEELAKNVFNQKISWDPSIFLSSYPLFIPRYDSFFGYFSLLKKLASFGDPLDTGTVIVHCDRCYNWSEVSAKTAWDECAACGSIMTVD
jgi:hypothetical protein